MWIRDPLLKSVPSLNIPDTIIYSNNEIDRWYFSSENQIKIKSKKKLNQESIIETFLHKKSQCGIVASWISQEKLVGQKTRLIYHYLDEQEFIKFFD